MEDRDTYVPPSTWWSNCHFRGCYITVFKLMTKMWLN